MPENQLLLFVIETTSECKSDEYYLSYLIKKSGFFDQSAITNLSLQFIYLSGKTNYSQPNITQEIKNKWNGFNSKKKKLFFVFDYDRDTKKDKNLNMNIINFCSNFEIMNQIIWFKKDVENVFLGKTIPDSRKGKEAVNYYTQGSADYLKQNIIGLTKNKIFTGTHESNVLSILRQCVQLSKNYKQAVEDNINENILKEGKKKNQKHASKKSKKSK